MKLKQMIALSLILSLIANIFLLGWWPIFLGCIGLSVKQEGRRG